ncbi:sensor histidine kinase [Salinibacillus xinjiangensis]|uniref:histidine kinase n=1 Tax=Salinibacillus xinjiangensis TaxID=1229268 RepID=A0A6G1X9Y9_9BACI|nr:sensor histidine kinase [Salinibacillus xinjiangensis]MRG87794.1 sensor histidine kinase [Salinibacillus xinjiangensis]
MIKQYLIERRSWIILVLSLQVLSLSIAYFDPSFSITSALYIVFLSVIILVFFLIIRYQKETRFYQSLKDRDDNLDLTTIQQPESPFEQIITESIENQTEQLKKSSSQSQVSLEQEKDELLAWIHEVKTPLTAMQLIIDRIEKKDVKEQLTLEWLRIHLLLDQQLHQKRMPFIENDLYIEKVQLEDILFEEIRTLQSWCLRKGIGFEVNLVEPVVLSDAKWLAFMIRQLLTNAAKYSENTDIVINSFNEMEQIRLEIKDSGRGIDSRDLPRIFEKGFTSTSDHQNQAATGMGLYLTQKVAKSLFIKLDVQSTLGQGTTFTLTFPKKNDFVNITSM